MRPFLLSLAAAVVACASQAVAQDYPSRPVRIIVPFLAGGPNDIVARLLAEKLSSELKGTFLVENIGGAGGRTGIGAVAKATADGYTLGLAAVAPLAISPQLVKSPGYDPVKSFTPIALAASSTLTIAINPSVSARTLKELADLARAAPDTLNYGSPGVGSLPHMAAELFQKVAGVKLRHVPYRGGSAAAQDLVAGHVQINFEAPVANVPLHRDGKVRVLAMMDSQRHPGLPDVPTTAEAGFANLEIEFWTGLVAPAGVPPAIAEKLSAAMKRFLAEREATERLNALGLRVRFLPATEFSALIGSETTRWKSVIDSAGIRVE